METSPATSERRLVKKIEYARHRNVSPSLVTRWIAAGRVVLEGKRIDLDASDRLLAGSLDPARGGAGTGSGGKPKRGAGKDTSATTAGAAGASDGSSPAAAVTPAASQSLIAHRAKREDFVARDAELRYLERAGALVPRESFERAVREGMGPITAAIDSLAPRIARQVVGLEDIRTIEAAIEAEVRAIRADLRKSLEALLSEPGQVRQ